MDRSRILRPAFVGVVLAAAGLALALGCGGSGSPSGVDDDDDPQPGTRIYVDASNSGSEDGTLEHPFNTIEEGMDAATRGDTLFVASGSYTRRDVVEVPIVVSFVGDGLDQTVVNAWFEVTAPADTIPVTFRHMAFDGATFEWNVSRDGQPLEPAGPTHGSGVLDGPDGPGSAAFPPRELFAPILIDSCDAGVVTVGYPPDHTYTVENSLIDSARFNHGECTLARRVIRNCQITGRVDFAHGSGDARTTVEDCTIGGGIRIASGSGGAFTITGNTVHGIVDKSGANTTTISWNTLPSGDLVDKSGGWGSETEIIEHNDIQNGVINNVSGCATVRYNTINAPADTFAILMNCGAPANLVGNTVTLPAAGAPPVDPLDWRDIGIVAMCGEGVIQDNTVTGGSIGLWDVSGVTEISGNTISGSYYGMLTGFGSDKTISANTISGCISDGVRFLAENQSYDYGPFEDNFIVDNGGAGVRLFRDVDLGGGAQGGWGGNVLTGNAGYDLVIEVPADSVAVIYAERNTWDHGSEGGIDSLDVYDANDDPSLADVDFIPLAN